VDLKKLSKADQLLGGGAILTVIFSLFPWYKAEVKGLGGLGGSATGNAFDYFLTGIIPFLLLLVLAAYVALPLFGVNLNLPSKVGNFKLSQIVMAVAILAAVLIVLRLLIGGGDDGGGIIEIKRQFGLWLATITSIVAAVGGFLKSQEPERGSAPPSAF